MAVQTLENGGMLARFGAKLRAMDPSGVYLRYTLYASTVAGLAAFGAFWSARTVAGAEHAKYAAVFAGLYCGLSMIFARPDPEGRRMRTTAIIVGALALTSLLSLAVSHSPTGVQILLVPLAFAGFYVRRWPNPAQSAGMIGTIGYLVIQILLPYTTPTVLLLAVPNALAGIAAGYWFLPHGLFHRGFVVAVRRLRAEIPKALQLHLDTPGDVRRSIRRIDALLAAAYDARTQADQYDPANSGLRLTIMHHAAVLARVWENAAEALHATLEAGAAIPRPVVSALQAGETAVGRALTAPSSLHGSEYRKAAEEALSSLDEEIGNAIAAAAGEDSKDLTIYAALNSELTLSHLLTTSQRLDETLAGQPGAAA